MNYGFIIDNRKCIGCHACSTACKSENEVPLGVYRTWVKYVETGAFPNNRRHFQVTRCNHCANPPCARICPVAAMYQRDDGIVEFDSSLCIGCKACLQACPYDAIYIDPNDGTAAKCHYCAHRTDLGLEPACVVVCPTQAIIAGDIDDPHSEISFLLSTQDVTVRKPEQGTAPKLFYIDGADVTLHPTAVDRTPESYMWADVIPLHVKKNGAAGHGDAAKAGHKAGAAWKGPISIGGAVAGHMVQPAYNAQHKIPWHWPVPAYLVTKAIGAGLFILLSVSLGFNWIPFDSATVVTAGFLSLLFIGITTGLLVFDLERPERFFSILLRPQWRSWLTRGAFILVGFSALAAIWWLLEAAAHIGLLPASVATRLRPLFLWAGLPLAVGAAIYTAFLFAQAEGRDLWQSSLLPMHMLIQSIMAGSAAYLLISLLPTLGLLPGFPDALFTIARLTFVISLLLNVFVTLLGEFGIPHASEVAAKAAHEISHGRYSNHFWGGVIGLGHLLPLLFVFMFPGWPPMTAVAGLLALAGLYLFEYMFIMAPQEIPNS